MPPPDRGKLTPIGEEPEAAAAASTVGGSALLIRSDALPDLSVSVVMGDRSCQHEELSATGDSPFLHGKVALAQV